MLDCTQLTYQQMADVVRAVWVELKTRNPIWVNAYTAGLAQAVTDLEEIHEAELDNYTSESGPAAKYEGASCCEGKMFHSSNCPKVRD